MSQSGAGPPEAPNPSAAFIARERGISVFVSGRISESDEWARNVAREELIRQHVFEPWLFEDASASAEPVVEGYLRRVAEADLVIWLVGADTSEPILREIRTALQAQRPVLIFRIDDGNADDAVERLVNLAGGRWSRATTAEELRSKLGSALQDELVRGFRRRPATLEFYFEQLRRASVARCVERWLALGLSEGLARSLVDDNTVCQPPPTPSGLTILVGPLGAGKSLLAERIHQRAIEDVFARPNGSPFPLFVEARTIAGGLRDHVFAQLQLLGGVADRGVSVVIDGLDEAAEKRSWLLTDARRLALEDPRNVLVVTSRESPNSADTERNTVINVPVLSEVEVLALMTRVAGRNVEARELWGVSAAVREALRRPLFAILAARAAKEQWLSAQSEGALIKALVERSLDAVDLRRQDAEPLLRKLARLSLNQGQAFLEPSAIGSYHELAPLFRSRIVVERETRLGFPLAILTQWFAAQSISAGEVYIDEICRDLTMTERWRPAIELHMYLEPGSNDTTRTLVLRRPGLASKVIEQRDADSWKAPAPPWNTAGELLRDAVAAWANGIGSGTLLTGRIGPNGNPRTVGIRTSGEYVESAWLRDDVDGGVVEVTQPMFSTSRSGDPRYAAALGASWRSPWHRGLVELRGELDEILKTKAFPPPASLLPEIAWFFAREIVGTSGWKLDGIPLELIRHTTDLLSKQGTLILGNRRLRSEDIHQRILPFIAQQQAGITRSPWPGPDKLVSGDLFDSFDIDTVVRRTGSVYEAALNGYIEIVKAWLPGLLPDLDLARQFPLTFEGIVYVDDNGSHGPVHGLTYSLTPNAGDSLVSLRVRLGSPNEAKIFGDRLIAARSGFTNTMLYDVLGHYPATELAYGWLRKDLRRIAWLK